MRSITQQVFIEIVIRKSSENDGENSKSSNYIQSADRLEIEFKVACDVIKSVNFAKFFRFHDVTCNFELDFRAIGWLYQGAAIDFSSSLF